MIQEIEKQESLSPQLSEDIIQTCYKREVARQAAQAAIEVMHGRSDSLEGIEKILQEYNKGPQEVDNLEETSDSLEELLVQDRENTQWKFNIASLYAVVQGIGPSSLSVVAARPEAGKTGFWVSLSAGPGGWAAQGATVLGICNEERAQKIKLRAYSACSGIPMADLWANVEIANEAWLPIKGRLRLIDGVGVNLDEVSGLIKRFKPDIVVIDQLDKMVVDGDFARGDEKLREIYTKAREIGKRNNVAVVGVSQLSADAHDRMNVDFSMLENSKTGKASEADLIFCIGASSLMGNVRQINIPKNKISGNHTTVNVQIKPEISRYLE